MGYFSGSYAEQLRGRGLRQRPAEVGGVEFLRDSNAGSVTFEEIAEQLGLVVFGPETQTPEGQLPAVPEAPPQEEQ